VTPSGKKEKGGVGGSPPSPPLCAKRLIFCMAKTCVSRGIAVVICGCWRIFWIVRVPARPGPEGEGGAPLRARHMGGGVIPSKKKEKGGVGGSPPSPPCPRCPRTGRENVRNFIIENTDAVSLFLWSYYLKW